MQNVYLVGIKTPHSRKKMLKDVPSSAAYAETKSERTAGLPRWQMHDNMYNKKLYVGRGAPEPFAGWVPEGFERISNLISRIEQRF